MVVTPSRISARGRATFGVTPVVIDKHANNLGVLRQMHPWRTAIEADLSRLGPSTQTFRDADAVVILQAQIGGIDYADFERNDLTSTGIILDCLRQHPAQLIHISSSVVNSVADDFYTRSKIAQEAQVVASGLPVTILRPTLMFGWFDRKHLGWLSRFMKKVPVFPVPGLPLRHDDRFPACARLLHQQPASTTQSAHWFAAVNVFAVFQTWAISLLLARHVPPWAGVTTHSETIAHAVGITVPVVSSSYGHKRFTFLSWGQHHACPFAAQLALLKGLTEKQPASGFPSQTLNLTACCLRNVLKVSNLVLSSN